MIREKSFDGEYKKYLENEDFFYFVSQEFNDVSRHATLEELAEFAFGDLEKAIEVFKKKSTKQRSDIQ